MWEGWGGAQRYQRMKSLSQPEQRSTDWLLLGRRGMGLWGWGDVYVGRRVPAALGTQTHILYLEVNAPSQRMALPIPQAELAVMAAGEETVAEGVRAEPPELIRVAL